jgi:hypothetical protein
VLWKRVVEQLASERHSRASVAEAISIVICPNTNQCFYAAACMSLHLQIVEFLKRPERFTAVGARIPKGCLLVGPPGTGAHCRTAQPAILL